MKKLKKKLHFSTIIFVVASIVNLIILAMLFYFFRIMIHKDKTSEKNLTCNYNSQYDTSDPFITKTQYFKNSLDGPGENMLDPVIGGDESSVVITMYSDIKCGYCYEQEKNIRKMINDYGEEVRFILKDYPEPNIDSLSWQASIAGRCAQAQDTFWDYHDLMYENFESLSENKFIEIAKSLNLNLKIFNDCIDSEELIELVVSNIVEARALSIKGLPSIYINDKEVSSKISMEELKNKINVEILKMKDLNK